VSFSIKFLLQGLVLPVCIGATRRAPLDDADTAPRGKSLPDARSEALSKFMKYFNGQDGLSGRDVGREAAGGTGDYNYKESYAQKRMGQSSLGLVQGASEGGDDQVLSARGEPVGSASVRVDLQHGGEHAGGHRRRE
jgi:hypothetical protein